MKLQLQTLIELQKIDSEIAELEQGKAAIPRQIESGRAGIEEKQIRLKEAEDNLLALQKKRKDLEMDVATENDHIAKTKTKLSAVKTNKEYSAILSEVDAVKEKILVLEDQELELMEILEKKEGEIPPLKAHCKEEEKKFNAYKLKKETEAERTEKELDVIRPRRFKWRTVLRQNGLNTMLRFLTLGRVWLWWPLMEIYVRDVVSKYFPSK